MRAVVLAAGRGARLNDMTGDRPKCLARVETRGFPWMEIDSPEDYWRACSDVLPALDDLGADSGRLVGVTRPRFTDSEGSRRPLHHV